jgi:hypothetical protein
MINHGDGINHNNNNRIKSSDCGEFEKELRNLPIKQPGRSSSDPFATFSPHKGGGLMDPKEQQQQYPDFSMINHHSCSVDSESSDSSRRNTRWIIANPMSVISFGDESFIQSPCSIQDLMDDHSVPTSSSLAHFPINLPSANESPANITMCESPPDGGICYGSTGVGDANNKTQWMHKSSSSSFYNPIYSSSKGNDSDRLKGLVSPEQSSSKYFIPSKNTPRISSFNDYLPFVGNNINDGCNIYNNGDNFHQLLTFGNAYNINISSPSHRK